MSGARAPAGIDTLDAEDERLLKDMRDAGDGDPSQDNQPEELAPEAESRAPAAPDAVEHQDDQKTVPSFRLREETEKRKAAEAERAQALKDRDEARVRFEERLRLISEATVAAVPPAPAPQEVPIPDYDSDPIGHLNERLRRAEQANEELKAVQTGLTQGQELDRHTAELRTWAMNQENAFAATTPDYKDAADFLQKSRDEELQAIGWTDAEARRRQILTDVTGIAMGARQNNGNFAEWLYNAAKVRGYQKAAPAPVVTPADPSTLPPLIPESTVRPPQQRRETLRQNSTSLGNVSGSAVPRALTPAQIADLDDVAFDRYVSGLRESQKRELFGD